MADPMTRIDQSAVITRETSALFRGNPLVITLLPHAIEIWPKGDRRAAITLTWQRIYGQAIEAAGREALRRRRPIAR